MTEEKLTAGLTDYLYLNQYGTAETEDLFDVLDLYGDNLPDDLDISTIMTTWTNLAGYPIVYCDGSSVTQDRFFLNPTSNYQSTSLFPSMSGWMKLCFFINRFLSRFF